MRRSMVIAVLLCANVLFGAKPNAPVKPMRIGKDVKAPVIIHQAAPDWSHLPKGFRTTGIVILEAVIDEKGRPIEVRALRGQPELANPAVAALKQWRFKPGRYKGKPVAVYFNVTVMPHYR